MTQKFIAYYRVSTDRQGQSGLGLEAQRSAVIQHIAGNGELVAEFTEIESGKKNDRPQLVAALSACRKQKARLLIAKLDRLARNLDDLRRLVTDLTGKGVRVEFIKEGLTFTGEANAMNRLLLSMLGAVAEFERELIRERQAEGIALAKERGVYKGRAKALNPEQVAEAQERVSQGIPKAKVARDLGVSRQTLYSALSD